MTRLRPKRPKTRESVYLTPRWSDTTPYHSFTTALPKHTTHLSIVAPNSSVTAYDIWRRIDSGAMPMGAEIVSGRGVTRDLTRK